MDGARRAASWVWRANGFEQGSRAVPAEIAVAITYNGSSYAVMMATPRDLEDFAVGFSLNERIVDTPDQLTSIDTVEMNGGVELRIWLTESVSDRLQQRRRQIAGPTGCGLCGVESIEEAMRALPIVSPGATITPTQIMDAISSLPQHQTLNAETRAVHAAAFWTAQSGIVALREDVGRHTALDKLAGALTKSGREANSGAVLLTSRISLELVQKTAMIGAPIIASVSAPTALAIDIAEKAGITLIAVARSDGFEVFTHKDRIV